MKSPFVIWKASMPPHVCILGTLEGVQKKYQLMEGVSRADGFPKTATFAMNPDFPDNTLLADNLTNSEIAIVASASLKKFLEFKNLPKVEYLPVTILNHKAKAASRDYCMVHPIEPVDCLDLKKCKPTWDCVEPTWIDHVERLVLDYGRIPADRSLFRPQSFFDVILIRRELAEAISGQGFTGIRWLELEKFPE